MTRQALLVVFVLTNLVLPLSSGAQEQLREVEPGNENSLSRFQRTVQFVQYSTPDERADFAAVALAELIAVYMAEADLARAEAAQPGAEDQGKLRGWSQAVDQYASQLMLVLEDVEQGFPVELRTDAQGTVTTTVADRAVILGHPRADQQPAYELRVLTDFCSDHNCQRMTVISEEAEPIPVSALQVNPLWTFTEDGPVCSNDGIEVHFHHARNLAILRGLCAALMQELSSLVMNLAWQERHGVVIDWGELTVRPTPGRPEHQVRLNAAGDSVLATLPLLQASSGLLSDIAPWLQARTSGDVQRLVLDAGKYGWVEPVNQVPN